MSQGGFDGGVTAASSSNRSTVIRALSAFLLLWSVATILLVEYLPDAADPSSSSAYMSAPMHSSLLGRVTGWRFWERGGNAETSGGEDISPLSFADVRQRRIRRALKVLDDRDRKAEKGEVGVGKPAASDAARPLSVTSASRALDDRILRLALEGESFGGVHSPGRVVIESCFRYNELIDGPGTVLVDLDGRCNPESIRSPRGGTLVAFNPLGEEREWCGKTLPKYSLAFFEGEDLAPCIDDWRDGASFPPASMGGDKSIEVKFQYGEKRERQCDVPCYYRGWVSSIGIVGDFTVRGTNWKITYSMEGAHYYPDVKIGEKDYLSNHFYTTTSFKSEVPIPYFSFEEYNIKSPPTIYHEAIKGASFIANNCNSDSKREKWVKELSKYIRVDSLSNCMHNADPPNGLDMSDKKKVMRQYLFHLAFENGVEDDYITEKIWGALESGTVPVYLGAPNIMEHVPRGSTINALDFSSPKELAEHLYAVIKDKSLYDNYHEWRNHAYDDVFLRKYNFTHVHSECRLCRWAYAKKFGYPWDHESQRIVEPYQSRSLCTSDHSGLAVNPFLEWWTGEKEVGPEKFGEHDGCGEYQKHKLLTYQNFTIHRTIEAHDNFIDLSMKVVNNDRTLAAPVYLKLSMGSHLQNGNVYTTSSGYGKAINRHVRWTGEAKLCKTGGTYVSIQDGVTRFTALSDWPTQMFSPQEGTVLILVHGGANPFAPKELSWKRLRIMLEDRDTLHKNIDDYMPSTFCRSAAKEFFQPLEFFYSGSTRE
mmetsp:Transcript_39063/g.117403  ORF Transcript_39063/g.117403 Transcript_39063/m.117403 type:complete len:764 (-) Transcript_39063:1533-3824(-)